VISRLKGTDDILPPRSARWRRLLRAFDDLAERFGYDFALMPAIEATELFARGVGEGTEVVEKQMYTFRDQSDRSVTLRPEFTAGIVRAYVDSGAAGPMKVATSGPNFRYEQPQKGRRRQFYQVDLEYLGEPGFRADVEVIEAPWCLFEEVGVRDVTVHLNSIGDAADRAHYRDLLTGFLRGVEGDLSEDARRRIDTNPLRVLDSKADVEVVAGAPVPMDHLGPESAAHFSGVQNGLDVLGIRYEMAPRLVRGLDYYNRTVFEFSSPGFEGAQSALGGGGRYDPLAEMIGSRRPVAAVGVALGCDRIVDAMPDPIGSRLDVFVVVADAERYDDALAWVTRLRGDGLRVDWIGTDRSVKAQFKAADRSAARTVAVVGEEWDQGRVAMKDLVTGDESPVVVGEVASWIKAR
jgi:histidyl-tRNA synthetase